MCLANNMLGPWLFSHGSLFATRGVGSVQKFMAKKLQVVHRTLGPPLLIQSSRDPTPV